jgi:MFS family permease
MRLRVALRGPLWSNRDFLRLWSAQTVSQFGSQVTNLALPFVAILVLKATTFEIAALAVVDTLPFVLLSLPAGVWVDRLRRRPILIVADWGRAAVLASVPIAYAVGVLSLAQLYVVGFVAGTLTVFFDVSYQSYLPSLVEREHLSDGNSKLATSSSAAQVAGPGLAGALIGALKAPYAIATDAASFVASALFMTRIQEAEALPEASGPRRMRAEIAEGLRYVVRHPLMRPGLLWVATVNFFTTLGGAILLVFAVRRLHLSAAMVGLIFSIGNIGVLAGALLAPRVSRTLGVGRAMIALSALYGASWLFIPTAAGGRAIPFLVTAQLLGGFCGVTANVIGISLYQAITPDRMLGRMNASRRFVVWGIMPFAGLLGGALGSHLGLRSTLWIAAVGATVAFLPMLFSPYRRVVTHDDGEEISRSINEDFISATAPRTAT